METSRIDGLDDQDTRRPTLHNQRGCQEGCKSFFARLREISEAGILSSSFKSNGLAILGDPADQTISHAQADMADRSGVQTNGGAQKKRFALRLSQIDRADVCVQTLGDQIGDIRERLLQVVRAGDDLSDIGKD